MGAELPQPAECETVQSTLEFLDAGEGRVHTSTGRAEKIFSCCAWLKEILGNTEVVLCLAKLTSELGPNENILLSQNSS